jgi:hypothetical protein
MNRDRKRIQKYLKVVQDKYNRYKQLYTISQLSRSEWEKVKQWAATKRSYARKRYEQSQNKVNSSMQVNQSVR